MAKVTDEELLEAFEALCRAYGVVSAGLDPDKITAPIDKEGYDGQARWAMQRRPGFGWLIVSGWKGVAAPFGCNYVRKRRDFLALVRSLKFAAGKV